MPLLPSNFSPPWFLRNGHAQTLYAYLFRRVEGVSYCRERIATPDGDFLDLDFSPAGGRRLSIVSHGLCGDSRRPYVLGMVKALNQAGWDALAWNFRGWGGEINRKARMTHSGATEDLAAVVDHALSKGYEEIALIGFSLGGNITLKYVGEYGDGIHRALKRVVAFSTPVHLESCARQLAKPVCKLYMSRFLKMLHGFIREKMADYPDLFNDLGYGQIKNFKQFDDRYVAPLHGFKDAEDYWSRSSSENVLESIRVPTLLVNAQNDPFLTEECFPKEKAEKNPFLFMEAPLSGGHVGFVDFHSKGAYWSERRALSFLKDGNF